MSVDLSSKKSLATFPTTAKVPSVPFVLQCEVRRKKVYFDFKGRVQSVPGLGLFYPSQVVFLWPAFPSLVFRCCLIQIATVDNYFLVFQPSLK